MFKVQKRDGRFENFERSKVLIGALKSGASNSEAEKLVAKVESLLPTIAINGVVKSQAIRSKILELLKTINPKVGSSFEFYRKPD